MIVSIDDMCRYVFYYDIGYNVEGLLDIFLVVRVVFFIKWVIRLCFCILDIVEDVCYLSVLIENDGVVFEEY